MITIYNAQAQSFLTDIDWWDSAFKIGLFLAIGLGLLIGRGLGGKLWAAVLTVFIWCLIYWPLWFVGSIFGFAAETYVDTANESAAVSPSVAEPQ